MHKNKVHRFELKTVHSGAIQKQCLKEIKAHLVLKMTGDVQGNKKQFYR